MAEKRMFTQKIIDSDAFLDMPLSTQALYFHLNMRADDDGFVNNPKKIQRSIGASDDDLKVLLAKRYIIGFESGVVVVKHWRMHNTLRKDRYNPTFYQEERAMLEIKPNGSYTEAKNTLATTWQPPGNHLATNGCQTVSGRLPQYSIDKNSIDKNSVSVEAHTRLDSLLEEYSFSYNLRQGIKQWVSYKEERGEPYSETTLKTLVANIHEWSIRIGDAELVKLIVECITANWKNLVFDRLKNKPLTQEALAIGLRPL